MSLFLNDLPKVELHAHLNGCIPMTLLRELAHKKGVTIHIPFVDKDEKAIAGGMYNGHPRSLSDCFALFAELPKVVDDYQTIRLLTRHALQAFASQHVVYLELRSTPKRLKNDGDGDDDKGRIGTKQQYIETVLEELRDFEKKDQLRYEQERSKDDLARLPLVARFIVSLDRSQSIQEALESVDLAISMNDPYIVGVDLGGNPLKRDFGDFRPILQKARQHCLKVTVHCAEIPCVNQAYTEAASILDFRPDRLGHAVLLPQPLLHELDKLRIPVETCPTSNTMTLELHHHHEYNLVTGLQGHKNVQHWISTNHPLIVCTDDPGIFDTNNTRELELLQAAFRVDNTWMGTLIKECMQYAFCDTATKLKVQSSIHQRIDAMLQKTQSALKGAWLVS